MAITDIKYYDSLEVKSYTDGTDKYEFYIDGRIKSKLTTTELRTWHAHTGNVKRYGTVNLSGELHGTVYNFNASGDIESIENWQNGLRDGDYTLYLNDLYILKGKYKDGAIDGLLVKYNMNNVKINETNYVKGYKHGLSKSYNTIIPYNLTLEKTYNKGLLEGDVKHYDNSGKIIKISKYTNGVLDK